MKRKREPPVRQLLHAIDTADDEAVERILQGDDVGRFVNASGDGTANCPIAECVLLLLDPTTERSYRATGKGPSVYDADDIERLRRIFRLLLANKHVNFDVNVIITDGWKKRPSALCSVELEEMVDVYGDKQLMRLLVEHHKIVDVDRFVCVFLRNGENLDYIDELLRRATRPIHYAVNHRYAQVVAELVKSAFEPNFRINETQQMLHYFGLNNGVSTHQGTILHDVILDKAAQADKDQCDPMLKALLQSPSILPSLPRITNICCVSSVHMKQLLKHCKFDMHTIPANFDRRGVVSRALFVSVYAEEGEMEGNLEVDDVVNVVD